MLQVLPLYSSADWEWLVPACLTVVLHYVAVTLMVNQVQDLKNTTTRTNRKDLSRSYHFSRPPSDFQPLFFIPITISRKPEQCRETVRPCMGCVTSMSLWPPGLCSQVSFIRSGTQGWRHSGQVWQFYNTAPVPSLLCSASPVLKTPLCLSQGAIRSEVRSQVRPLLSTGSLPFLHPFYMAFKGNQCFPERACILPGW